MKVSVITPCFNSAKTLRRTIESVNIQSHNEIEHIFVDGGSSDGSLDLIRAVSTRSPRILSEKDKGLYDAMNKGFRLATGDIIGILNSDDWYATPSVVEQ